MNKENSFENLYKKVDATSKTRFNASRRLKSHSKYSTYIIVFISLCLILISLMQAYDLGINIKSNWVVLIQVFASITVLIYSLLIENHNYSNLSEKMYSCASKLGDLKQKIHPHLENNKHEVIDYNDFRKKYKSIFRFYETHSVNDFTGDYIKAKLEMPEYYELKGIKRVLTEIKIKYIYFKDFFSYFLVIGIFIAIFYFIYFGW